MRFARTVLFPPLPPRGQCSCACVGSAAGAASAHASARTEPPARPLRMRRRAPLSSLRVCDARSLPPDVRCRPFCHASRGRARRGRPARAAGHVLGAEEEEEEEETRPGGGGRLRGHPGPPSAALRPGFPPPPREACGRAAWRAAGAALPEWRCHRGPPPPAPACRAVAGGAASAWPSPGPAGSGALPSVGRAGRAGSAGWLLSKRSSVCSWTVFSDFRATRAKGTC